MNLLFHGNFESAADWSFLGSEWKVFSLWEMLKNSQHLQSWDEFIQKVMVTLGDEKFAHVAGYSLGGRILLNLVDHGFSAPRLSFISTHPGLRSDDERAERIWSDLKWKERVLKLEWKDLFLEWNEQEVFVGDISDIQLFNQVEIHRAEVAYAFDLLSLGRMKSFVRAETSSHSHIHRQFELSGEVEWICGEADEKFSALGRDFTQSFTGLSNLKFTQIPGVGHRVHKRDPFSLMPLLQK